MNSSFKRPQVITSKTNIGEKSASRLVPEAGILCTAWDKCKRWATCVPISLVNKDERSPPRRLGEENPEGK